MMRIDTHTHYRDEGCDRIEDGLRTRSEYNGWTAHRLRMDETIADPPPEMADPFDIRDSEAKHMTWIYDEELVLLDTPELIAAYIGGNAKRETKASKLDLWIVILAVVGMLFISLGIFLPWGPDFLFRVFFNLFVAIMFIIFIYLVVRWRNSSLIEVDISVARTDPVFREALSRLAVLAEHHPQKYDKLYDDRHEAVEKALAD